jgi:hypothetical protein
MTNKSRQPMPVDRHDCIRAPLARHGCALRGPMRSQRPILLVIGTIGATLLFLLLSPATTIPPRLSEQMDKAVRTLGASIVPLAWGFYLLFTYRNLKERILAYFAIAVSLFWVAIATEFVIHVMKERKIRSASHRVDRTAAEPRRFVSGGENLRTSLDAVSGLPAAVGHSNR